MKIGKLHSCPVDHYLYFEHDKNISKVAKDEPFVLLDIEVVPSKITMPQIAPSTILKVLTSYGVIGYIVLLDEPINEIS